ncbi:HAD-IIIA family hydrolase [Gilvimarinus sp. SDUM040013]|uniref:HAD-IIIA family hydrolase n=1 Tax=Gilvimarinus gilvus TaxID=3058038 RepID=A0ABU4RX10_9GAMM|nr:HAD-IIIA family hydrolase [Gilvimarinus sp. SDUM040013]MDO3385726.1 HAD-IIIA family hydrolase [Gilvimarinus sp. SDUM040013]MDX6849365.1 HAD-IIIA family hydrolase [Gilvimarinus sp. SDUM040013]
MFFIFDWDGTLSDSTGTIVLAMQRAAEDLGWERPASDKVRNIIGLGLPEAIEVMYPGIEQSDFVGLRDGYRKHYLALDKMKPAAFYPKVLETLQHLKSEGHILAVATGKSRRGLDRVLKSLQLEDFFHASRCADETASKPDPLMLAQLMTEMAVGPQDSVMVGDTEYDMEMGRRAGMDRIAVSYGAHEPGRLTPYDPALCLDCFSGLLAWDRL